VSVNVDLEPSQVALNLNNMHEDDGAVRLCIIFELDRMSIVGSREGLFRRLDSSSNLNAGVGRGNVVFECTYFRFTRVSTPMGHLLTHWG